VSHEGFLKFEKGYSQYAPMLSSDFQGLEMAMFLLSFSSANRQCSQEQKSGRVVMLTTHALYTRRPVSRCVGVAISITFAAKMMGIPAPWET